MSFLLMAKTIRTKVKDPLAKWLLLILADYSNEDTGKCFPSLNTLARRTEMHVATVSRKLEYLEKNGFIKRQQREAASTLYQLLLAESDTPIALCDTPSRTVRDKPINEPITNNKAERKNRTQIPNDWVPTAETIEILSQQFEGVNHKDETDQFICYHQSKGNSFININSAYRNWVRNSIKFKTERASNSNSVQPNKSVHNYKGNSFFHTIAGNITD